MIGLAAQELQQPDLLKLAPAVWSGTTAYRAAFPVGNLDKAWEAEVGPGHPHRLHEEMVIVVRPHYLVLVWARLICRLPVHWC